MKIKNIKLFVKKNEKSRNVANELESELIKNGFNVVDDDFDLAISVGGDGSFLNTLRQTNFNSDIYYIGVNSGSLGFLQEIDIKDCSDFVKRLKEENYKVEELSIQETKVTTSTDTQIFNSLNEVVIRHKHFKTLRLPIYVDNELLEEFAGDGLLISTSTGSTAYNMSLGGSIIYDSIKSLSITPIAPINSRIYSCLTSSLVVPEDKIINMKTLDDEKYKNLFFMIDGDTTKVDDVVEIETKISKRTIKCLRIKEQHFIRLINNKLIDKQ